MASVGSSMVSGLKRLRIFQRSDAFADLNASTPAMGDDIARNYGFRFIALESPEGIQLGDFG